MQAFLSRGMQKLGIFTYDYGDNLWVFGDIKNKVVERLAGLIARVDPDIQLRERSTQ